MSGIRAHPPWRRASVVQRIRIADTRTMFVGLSVYEDGRPADVWLDTAKEGSELRGYMRALALSISVGFQYGVPADAYVKALLGLRFEPMGPVTGHRHIKECLSPVDAVARELGVTFCGREDLCGSLPSTQAGARAVLAP